LTTFAPLEPGRVLVGLVGWAERGDDANKDKANAERVEPHSIRLRADPPGPVIGCSRSADRLASPSSSSHFIQTKPRVLTASVVHLLSTVLAYNSPMPSRMRRCFTARCRWTIHVIMAPTHGQEVFFRRGKKYESSRRYPSHIETRGSKTHCFFLQLHSFGPR